jgi:SAM-dependent methyltransferase
MHTSRWEEAQENELAVSQHTVNSISDLLDEIAETAALVRFGTQHGLGSSGNVLELGIGPLGVGWSAFTPTARAVGVDSLARLTVNTSDDSIDRFFKELQARTDFLQADATARLPMDDANFDLIVCENVVDHTQDPRAVLAEGRRLVRPDGRLLFGVNVFSIIGIMKWRQVTRRLHPRDPNVLCHPHSFLENDLVGLLSSAGWKTLVTDDPPGIMHRVAGHSYRVRAIAQPI